MNVRLIALSTIIIFNLFTQLAYACTAPARDLDKEDESVRRELIQGLYTDPSAVLANQQMTKDVSELLEKHGISYFAVFGTLLGALRQKSEKITGGLIPWDDDSDLAIFLKDMGKIRDRPFRGALKELGYKIIQHADVGLQIQETTQRFNPKTKKSYTLFVDIFLFQPSADGLKYELYPDKVKTDWPRGWFWKAELEDLVRIPFGQFSLMASSKAEAYLTRLYRDDWKTTAHYYWIHHAQFQGNMKWTLTGVDLEPAQPTGPLTNRVKGMPTKAKPPVIVTRRESLSNFNLGYWNKFYAAAALAREPSSFCEYILDKQFVAQGATLLDIGCGNGRDTFAFRHRGIQAFGLDSSSSATESNQAFASKQGITQTIFRTVDVCNAAAMAEYTAFDAVYARFFIHAINEAQEAEFMKYISTLSPGTRLFLEFRTDRDPMLEMSTKVAPNKGKTDHYRRFIHFDDFAKKIYNLGFTLNETKEADNLSVATKVDPVKGQIQDNPMLGRIIATKK